MAARGSGEVSGSCALLNDDNNNEDNDNDENDHDDEDEDNDDDEHADNDTTKTAKRIQAVSEALLKGIL